ncbi:MAG TPA: hypothetical protein G4O12_04255 [Dehalococcoidia bacterium]|nr:hypothetical protein [Dehalococcoidia bacterium]
MPTSLAKAQGPPLFALQHLNVSPQQANAGQPVTISINVLNNGGQIGNYNLVLKINGRVEQTKMVSVSPGTAYPVKFTVYKSEPGTYNVAIDGHHSSFTILGGGSIWSGGLTAILIMSVLVIAAVVVLILTFRRPA